MHDADSDYRFTVLVHPGIFARLVSFRREIIVGIAFANAAFSVISQHAAGLAI